MQCRGHDTNYPETGVYSNMTRHISAAYKGVWLSILILACTAVLHAASWVPLDRDAVVLEARAITKEAFPDADVVAVDQKSWIRYQPDGTYVEWLEQYVKVLTEKGRRNYRTLTSSFNTTYNNTRFTLVEVISQDGTVRRVDVEKNSAVMVDSSQMTANIYDPNSKVLQVSVPELNIGDTVHLITYDEFFKPRMADEFSDYVTFEDTDPIKRATYIVVAPEAKPLKSIALKNEIPGTVNFLKTTEGEEIVYQWKVKDVPRAFLEPEMPPLYTQAQRLLVSTIPDWRNVSRWYWNLSKPHLEKTTPQMRTKVKGITKGLRGRQKKIDAIFFWVSQEVRYLGITAETEAPGYEPHDVSMTFERRAGVCRDKAALLVSMLRLAGFEAYPVLIMNGPKKDPEVPQPFFNHAIVSVKNKDGSYQLMDPTDENTKELFPAYLNDQSYLVATPRGETLLTSTITPAGENMMRITTTGNLDHGGMLRADTTLTYEGINDNAYRGYLSMLSDDERRIYFEKILRKVVPSASLQDLELTPANMLDTSVPVRARLSFTAAKYPVPGNGVTLLPVFRFGDSIGIANYLIQKMGLKERRFTYRTDTACGIEETTTLKLDKSLGRPVGGPVQEAAVDSGATWIRSLEYAGGELRARNLFQLKLTEYGPEQYKALQDTLKRVEKANRFIPVFAMDNGTPAGGTEPWYAPYRPDAVVLKEEVRIDVVDPSTIRETSKQTIKVLTYAGKKKMGEIHVAFNPVWEEVRMEKALVTSPAGQVTRIDPNEINVMDQDWVGKAPRYPAGKMLVASLPGLQEGSVIEYEMVRIRKDNRAFLISSVFQGEDPVESATLTITMPEGFDLHVRKADSGFSGDPSWNPFPEGFVKETRENTGGRTVVTYSAGYVPPLKQEDNLPLAYCTMPVVYASAVTMKEYAEEARTALEKASASQPLARSRSLEITRGMNGEEQKITAIRDFVAQNIKAIAVPISGLPLSLISPADTTLADGYGNRADTAVLLKAMLAAAGFDTQFVLVSSASPVPELREAFLQFPASEWFGTVLVKVGTASGEIYLGDTDQYATLGAVTNADRPSLNLRSGAVEPVRPKASPFEDRTDFHLTIDLDAAGDAVITQRRTYYGMDDGRFRRDYVETTPEERRRRYEELVSSVSRSAVALGPYTASTGTYPAFDEFTVKVPGYAVRKDDLLTLELPALTRGLPYVSGDERINPLYREVSRDQKIVVDLVLPEDVQGIVQRPPEERVFRVPHLGNVTLSTRIVPQEKDPQGKTSRMRVSIEQIIENRPAMVMPGEYPDLVSVHRSLAYPGMRTIVMRLRE